MRRALTVLAILALSSALTAQTMSITTTFQSNNGGSTNWVNMFDITILEPGGLNITALDVNSSSGVNTTFSIAVYITPTTYVGKDGNPSAWTQVSQGNGVAQGRDKPTPVDVADFVLQPGTYGIGIHYLGTSMAYTNGTGQNQSYANNEVSLKLGLVRAGFFTGTTFTPRVWNGTIYYQRNVTVVGSGTAKINSPMVFSLSSPGDATLPYQLGSSFGNGPIPIDTRKLGLSPDDLLVISVSGLVPSFFRNYAGVLDAQGGATATLNIPNFPILVGTRIYSAFVTLNASAPSGIASISSTFDFMIRS